MKKIWVLGDAVVDLLPAGDNLLQQCPGGAPANVAVGAARLGGESGFIGCVGNDPFGRFMQRTLEQEGVDTRHMVLLDEQRTSTVLVGLDAQGERSFTFMVRPSADLFLVEEHLPDFEPDDALHFCSIALSAPSSRHTVFSAVERLHAAGGWVSFDPNIRDDLWTDKAEMLRVIRQAMALADVIKLSHDELALLTGIDETDKALQALTQEITPSLLFITHGAEGVTVWRHQQVRHYPAMKVRVVDTTGAGDAFVAGLLTGLMAQENPADPDSYLPALELAQRCGAQATTAKGAMTALPRREDIAG